MLQAADETLFGETGPTPLNRGKSAKGKVAPTQQQSPLKFVELVCSAQLFYSLFSPFPSYAHYLYACVASLTLTALCRSHFAPALWRFFSWGPAFSKEFKPFFFRNTWCPT